MKEKPARSEDCAQDSGVRADQLRTHDPLHAEAANWFVRLNTREPDTEEVADWQRWLLTSDAHRRAFAQFEDLWQKIGQTEQHFATQDPSVRLLIPRRARAHRRWPLALAATVLVGAVGALFLGFDKMQSRNLPASAVIQTRTAQDQTYSLPDGSRIEVGASTRMVVDFSTSIRSVIIDAGEAYFEVAHDAERPFVVHAGDGTITAVGTAFNVHHALGRVSVAVVEGAVNVQRLARESRSDSHPTRETQQNSLKPFLVHAGEGIAYGRATPSVEAVDTRVATAWRAGHLKFIREPLAYVVADVERYADLQISIADVSVGELLYTGTVIPEELDDWLTLLSHAFPIEVQRIDKRAVLLKRRNTPPQPLEPV